MKVLISGSTGLVGSALVDRLRSDGDEVVRLVRGESKTEGPSISWDPQAGTIDSGSMEGADALVHLAGENIASGRWTERKKSRIRQSRVKGTELLAETLVNLREPPPVWISASAIGYYGDRGEERLNEESSPGEGYLADVCRDWEAATNPAHDAGIRVVCLRLGVVLSSKGGALAKMLLPFKMGLGGKIGTGKQYMSWITLEELVGVIGYVLATQKCQGPINAVAPTPVTNLEFSKTLGRVLSRPTIFPMPAFVARLMFGEMADELLLSSTRVEPSQLGQVGFPFEFPELESALRKIMNDE